MTAPAPQSDTAPVTDHESLDARARAARDAYDAAKKARRAWDYEAHYGRNEPTWKAKAAELDDAFDIAGRDLTIVEAEVTRARQQVTATKLDDALVPHLLDTRHKLAEELDTQLAHVVPIVEAILEVDRQLDAALRSSGTPATFSTGQRFQQNLSVWIVRKLAVGYLRRSVGFTMWKTPERFADMVPRSPSTLPPIEFASLVPADFAGEEEE